MELTFTKKTVIVTGAGAGIGKAAALAYGRSGANVVVNSLSLSAKKVEEEILSQGGRALFVQGDVSKKEDAARIIEETVSSFGSLHILVNNAGIVAGGTVEEVSEETWDRVMEVNVKSIYLMSRLAMPYLKQTKGVIVNTSSVAAVKGLKDRAVYSASKGAVLSLSSAMATDYMEDGVRVNCVLPGTTLTESLEERIASADDPEAAREAFIRRQPMKRLGTPEEIGAAILFASSEEAGFMNGAKLLVDGGMNI